MTSLILSIGDELVLGQTVDTNSAWLSQQLAAAGCDILGHATVPDDQPAIERAIRDAAPRCDCLIISGGIGPTADDLTRQALAAVMGADLVPSEEWLAELRAFFAQRGRPMPDMNTIQAMIPRGAQMLWNTCGTAAGIHATLPPTPSSPSPSTLGEGRGEGTNNYQLITNNSYPCETFVVPGVPKEMKAMFTRDILPHVRARAGGAVILSRTLHTFGLGESWVAEKLGDLMRRDRNPSVGTTVSGGIVSLRVNARFGSAAHAQRHLDDTAAACRAALGDMVFGQDAQTLPHVCTTLLRKAGQTVATAESCTGGLLATYLTDTPGSSASFTQGWVTYSNEAKSALLGVPAPLIQQHGAVSEPVVLAMAAGAQQRSGADVALAVSGIAGPDGGTPQKPVGTVCFALATAAGATARTFVLAGDREMIRDRAAKMALTLLRFHLLATPLPF